MSKKILLIVCSITILSQAWSQTCQNFLFMQKNKTVELTINDKKGGFLGKQVYQVSDVNTTGGITTASLATEMFDKKGKSMMKANSSMQCTGGSILIDMKMMIPQQQAEQYKADVKAQTFYIEYPSAMHVGDQLKDGNLTLEMNNHGLDQTLNLVISNRKVLAEESVTTPAGTWNCFKISFHSKVDIKTGFMSIPFNMDGTEWYAPAFGIVKTESKHGTTEITSIK